MTPSALEVTAASSPGVAASGGCDCLRLPLAFALGSGALGLEEADEIQVQPLT